MNEDVGQTRADPMNKYNLLSVGAALAGVLLLWSLLLPPPELERRLSISATSRNLTYSGKYLLIMVVMTLEVFAWSTSNAVGSLHKGH